MKINLILALFSSFSRKKPISKNTTGLGSLFFLTQELLRYSFLFLFPIFVFLVGCKKEVNDDLRLENNDKIKTVEVKRNYGYGVVNVNRLRLRSDGDLHSKTLRYLDKGAILKIVEKTDKRVRIDEMEDYWYNVDIEGVKGYVFGYFIDIYTDYENANYTSRKYIDFNVTEKSQSTSLNYENFINKNLFFLSNGKLVQVIDYKKNKAKILNTESNVFITNYYFPKEREKIYYLGKTNNNVELNGNLYLHDTSDDLSTLVMKEIYAMNINIETNTIQTVKLQRTLKDEYWIIKFYYSETGDEKEIIKIKKTNRIEDLENDVFSNTLKRETGTLAYIDFDNKKNFIYFKPPEENQTYLISMADASYIKIDIEKSNLFHLDDSKYLQIYSLQDENGNVNYSLVLKEKYTSFEKEILKSKYYPTNVSVSPRQGFAALSVVSTDAVKNNFHPGDIYLLSLETQSLMPISTDGNSYQAKWSYELIE